MAVLSSAKNDAQFSSSFFHLKNSSFESLSNSAAMLAVFCVTPTPAGKVKKMRADSRLLSQGTFAVVDDYFHSFFQIFKYKFFIFLLRGMSVAP